MVKDKIYTEDDIQSVWKQFHYNPKSIIYSDDGGNTWNKPPSMDTGKWAKFSIVNGNRVEWIYKIIDKVTIQNPIYKYDKDTCKQCDIYKDGWCQFSQTFIDGCKEGRAMLGCNECLVEKSKIILF